MLPPCSSDSTEKDMPIRYFRVSITVILSSGRVGPAAWGRRDSRGLELFSSRPPFCRYHRHPQCISNVRSDLSGRPIRIRLDLLHQPADGHERKSAECKYAPDTQIPVPTSPGATRRLCQALWIWYCLLRRVRIRARINHLYAPAFFVGGDQWLMGYRSDNTFDICEGSCILQSVWCRAIPSVEAQLLNVDR